MNAAAQACQALDPHDPKNSPCTACVSALVCRGSASHVCSAALHGGLFLCALSALCEDFLRVH